MSVDNELLDKSNKDNSAAQAGDLRETRRSGNSSQSAPRRSGSSSLREEVIEKKRELARMDLKGKALAAVSRPVNKGTSKLLQQAWLNLIDSFGLTLIWIDIHVWLGSIFGNNFFCKLGAEWLDSNIAGAQADYSKSQGGLIGSVEPMLLSGCNIGCLLIIIFLACLVAMILGVIKNPLLAIAAVIGYLWNFFKLWK